MRVFCLFVAAASLCCSGAARAELVTAVEVVVNDSVITVGDIDDAVRMRTLTARKLYGNDAQRYVQERDKLRVDAAERQVEDKLVLHEFLSKGYDTNLLEAVIDDRIRADIKERTGGDRGRFITTLHEQGKTYESYRREVREDIIIDYMNHQNSSVTRKILISPLKVEQYYKAHTSEFKVEDQVHLFMIDIPQSEDDAPGAAYKRAQEILAKIDGGVPFAEMAGVYSAGSHRAQEGDRGWVDRTYLKTALSETAFSLKPGQHSGVIQLPESCYLMMVTEVRPAHTKAMSEVSRDIERTLMSEEWRDLRKRWIERLRNRSFVRLY